MKQKPSKPWVWSILFLIILGLSLGACATQATITESPTLEAAQTRNIKVYESPT